MRDAAMALDDGGAISYTEAGAPDGLPILYFHGAPGSRLDAVWLDDKWSELGVRVVSADRPGYGGSSNTPGRDLVDWPGRVEMLADDLGIDRFAVLGLSSGGPYAVVTAALLPERVVGAAVVAGVTDMGGPAALADFFEGDEKTVMQIGDEDAAYEWCVEHYGEDGSRYFDGPMDLSPPDAKVMEDEVILGGLLPSFAEAFVQGVRGYAQDITVQGRPWAFDVAAIRCPVAVYHGEQDTIVPTSHGHHTAEIIADASMATFPQHGHLSMVTEMPGIVTELRDRF